MEKATRTSFTLEELNRESTLTTNVQQDYIVTTYDKLKLTLIEYDENRKLALNWWSYLGMALSFILPCFTAEFQPFLIFSAKTMESMFIMLSIAFSIVTAISIIKRIKNRKKITVEYCVNRIKNQD